MSILQEIRKYGLRLGQDKVFLIDENFLDKEVGYAQITKGDTVLEIGCGIGNLTERLVEKAGKVIAVEKDANLAKICRVRVQAKNLEVITGDALKIALPRFDRAVSNLPYSISAPITFRLLEQDFKTAVLVYQKEFGDKMVAQPGDSNYGRLSVMVQAKADVELLDAIPKTCFTPVPKVDSRIIRLTPRRRDLPDNFADVVRALFQHRRKLCKNALSDSAHELKGFDAKKSAKDVCPQKNVFKLSIEEIVQLCKKMQAHH
ncbi:MAG: 16S rRNA (adenine(1518)-N(6)/adenine(1519)-N(6))-dimethyltransferase RsmA [archaeon]